MKNNAAICCRILCGTIVAAEALALPCGAADVTVTPGFDFANVVVSVFGATGAQFSLSDSANSPVASDAPLAPASAYAYDVRLDGASIASGAFATGSEETPAASEWAESLMVVDGGRVPVDDVAFAASPSNRVTRTDVSVKIGYFLEEESLPLPDAPFAAIAAVTNSAGVPGWRAWNGGWVRLEGPAPQIDLQYAVRVVIDFRHVAPRTCYLISEDGGETYVVLKHGGNAWIESPSSSADRVSSVKVAGMDVAVTHRAIDGTATARYVGESGVEWTEYSQAKWNLRRALGDAVRNIPSNLFTMIDLQYTFMLQSFGLIRSNALKEFVYRRPSWYAMRNLYSLIDCEAHPVSVTTEKGLTCAVFERRGKKLSFYWRSSALPDQRAHAGDGRPPGVAARPRLGGDDYGQNV